MTPTYIPTRTIGILELATNATNSKESELDFTLYGTNYLGNMISILALSFNATNAKESELALTTYGTNLDNKYFLSVLCYGAIQIIRDTLGGRGD